MAAYGPVRIEFDRFGEIAEKHRSWRSKHYFDFHKSGTNLVERVFVSLINVALPWKRSSFPLEIDTKRARIGDALASLVRFQFAGPPLKSGQVRPGRLG
ncbi:MAG: hypothetical protein AABZ47_10445 [Planctomycetota bacterium]